jgi:hypothetical protein
VAKILEGRGLELAVLSPTIMSFEFAIAGTAATFVAAVGDDWVQMRGCFPVSIPDESRHVLRMALAWKRMKQRIIQPR